MRTIKTYIKVGRKTIEKNHENFEYYQPNEHICGDCALRAVSKATKGTWYTVFDNLIPIARKRQDMPNSTDVIGEYLKEKGFVWKPVKAVKGQSRPTVAEFAAKHKNPCVLRVSNHLTSSEDGKYYDIWDCGDKCLYGYWEKVEKNSNKN